MLSKYGSFDNEQIKEYKVILHKKLFRLLLFKDPSTKAVYQYVNFERYFDFLMKELDGLNELLLRPPKLVELMSTLEAALIETHKDDYQFQNYRKLILDSHHLVDEIWEVI